MVDRLQNTPEELVQANVEALLAQPQEAFQKALADVSAKNAELYRRLATA